MKQGIIVTTSSPTNPWLSDCLLSLKDCGYPIVVVHNGVLENNDFKKHINIFNAWNGFEFGGIKWGAELFDEFIHLPASTIIKDKSVLKRMFDHDGSAYFSKTFFHYAGKYRSDVLKKVGIPIIHTKQEAIDGEHIWHHQYLKLDDKAKLFEPELPVVSEVFEEKYGRKNMVVENDFIKKWKGTWG